MLVRKKWLEEIQLSLAKLESAIAMGSPLNFTDLNLHAEDFVGGLLNKLYGWDLVTTNAMVANYPCIDLLDKARGVGVQVTSQRGVDKINSCVDCCTSHLGGTVRKLYVFLLVRKQRSYKLKPPMGIEFDRDHIIDFADVFRMIRAMDYQDLDTIHAYFAMHFVDIYSARNEELKLTRESILKCLVAMDREVFQALERHEDPVLMFKAIREIRVSLRKNGAKMVRDDIAAGEFSNIINELLSCERTIEDDFPFIAKPGANGVKLQGLSHDDRWMKPVARMIQIRNRIHESRSIIEDRLTALGG